MTTKSSGTVTLVAGGDIGPVIEPVDQFVELVLPVWRQADLRFGQCERTYSERGYEPHYAFGGPGGHARLPPRMASIWQAAEIDIVSLAGNHAMEWGPDPMLDTVELFRSMGKHVVGAGKDEAEARAPAIVERNGVKIAFLAYCSILRDGQAAAAGKPGVAPMRAHTHYLAEDFHPHTPPTLLSVPFDKDLAALEEDIKAARKQADAVVVSMHWGIRFVPKTIATYQPVVAHTAIDAGADLILGHHAHVPKAIEVYKGKVCFYSIGNFLTNGFGSAKHQPLEWNLIWFQVDPEYSRAGYYSLPEQCRKTTIAKAIFSKNGVERVSFLPAYINPRAQPQVLAPDDPKFREMLAYMEWVSDQYPHQFSVEGGEVVVQA